MDMIEELEAMRKRVLQEINAEFDLMIARMERMEAQGEVPYESTYSLTAGAGIFRGTKPTSVIFPDGKRADVRSWKDVAEAVMKRCVEDRKEAAKKQEAVYEKRPELSITEYADCLSRPGYGVKKKCDMELFLALLSLDMTDSSNRCWRQPLFAPEETLYDSRPLSKEAYQESTKRMKNFRNIG